MQLFYSCLFYYGKTHKVVQPYLTTQALRVLSVINDYLLFTQLTLLCLMVPELSQTLRPKAPDQPPVITPSIPAPHHTGKVLQSVLCHRMIMQIPI